MTLRSTDAGDQTILALAAAMQAWQRALDATLSTQGLNYVKWTLLRAIAHGDYVRHQPYVGVLMIDVDMAERLLQELYRARWIVFADKAGRSCGPALHDAQPLIAAEQRARIDKIGLAIKALHSVSVSPFNLEERSQLCALLQRMEQTLNNHASRQQARGDDIHVTHAPLIRSHTMLGASPRKPDTPRAARPRTDNTLSWRG